MSYQLKIEKMISRSASDIFRAISQGKLFLNCGAAADTIKVDFRVGGEYFIHFHNKKKHNFGTFLEIIPNKKIVFSWCQQFGPEQKPDTQVTIELFEEGAATKLVLMHDGFKDQALCDGHRMGWTTGLVDMLAEIENGQLRFLRSFDVSIEKLFDSCKKPSSFFAYMGNLEKGAVDFRVGGKYQLPTQKGEIKGEFLEIVPNEKISFSWLVGCSGPLANSKVILNFKPADNGGSKLELIHQGLFLEDDQLAHRQGWGAVTQKMAETLSS